MPLGTIGALIVQYKYLVMIPLIPIAQPLVGMVGGLLIRIGVMELWIVYALLVSIALVGDVMWYWVGYHWGEKFVNKFGRFISVTPVHVASAKRIFDRYHAPILLISKITNGLGLAIAVLFTAGLTKVPFGRYMLLNVIGECIWSAIVIAVGYYFGEAYVNVHDDFQRITLAALFVFFILFVIGFGGYLRKRIERTT